MAHKKDRTGVADHSPGPVTKKLGAAFYEEELARLSIELVKLQEWVHYKGLRVVVLFEGRDAAGKGGAIKRITEPLNPRICRVVALSAPTERERTQWYYQRYVAHLPAAGEMVLFDRSWYNRAGVEQVMGFCTEQEYEEFLRSTPEFERMLIRSGIILIKYWFSVSDAEQERRMRRMRAQVDDHNIFRWAGMLLSAIGKLIPDTDESLTKPDADPLDEIDGDIGRGKFPATFPLVGG